MTEKCYQPDDFERLLESPVDHADRRHLKSCAACRSQLDLYRSFMSRGDMPAGADLADANVRLGDFLVQEIVGGKATGGAGTVLATGRRWDLRRWSPVLVAASLVGFALFVNSGSGRRIVSPSGVMRDTSTATTDLMTSEEVTADGFVLTWQGPAAAEQFQVVVLDVSMVEVGRFATGQSSEYHLAREDHGWLRKPGPYLWYVIALQGGDEIARSAVRVLESGP